MKQFGVRNNSPINNQFTASANVVDSILENLGGAGSFNDDAGNSSALLIQSYTHGYILETVWVFILDLLELNFWV
jgi:hypothetical protein